MYIFILLTQRNMITNSKESSINKSAVNRHSCMLIRKGAPVRFIPSAPVDKNRVKKQQENAAIEPSINDEPEQQIIEEYPKEFIENQAINIVINEEPEKQIIQKNPPAKIQPKEESVQPTVNDVPVERKVEIDQRNVSKIMDNRVVNTGRHYTYNSILGTRIRYD